MLAMMVVTAGVVLLTFALAAVVPADRDNGEDQGPARRTLDRLIADARWTIAPGVLRASELDEVVADHGGAPPRGCRAVLQVVGGGTVELFAEGERGSGQRWSASQAVSIYRGPQDVGAGTVTVWVWT